jgi:hypothetical protein
MTTKAQMSALTATGDTVKTLIDTITMIQSAKKIIGIWCYAIAGAALTTAEAATGVVEFESDDSPIAPLQLPLDVVNMLTGGAVAFNPRIFPVDIPINGQAKIKGSVTMDMAQTGGLKARFGFIIEAD